MTVDPRRRAWLAHCAVLAAAPALSGCDGRSMIERFFFYPDRVLYTRPEQFGLAHEDLWFSAQDGSRLHGWWLPAAGAAGAARGSVLHLHGNAANISNHLPLVTFLPRAGFNVLMFDYRGFGESAGQPSLAGVVADAHKALHALRSRKEVDPQRLVVFGQSLGAATALRLLARDRAGVRLGIIDSGFASYRGIARDAARHTPLGAFLPMAMPLLPAHHDDPEAALASVDIPLLFIHGTADPVVPIEHGDRLFALAREPKQFLRVDGAAHLQALLQPALQAQVVAAIHAALA